MSDWTRARIVARVSSSSAEKGSSSSSTGLVAQQRAGEGDALLLAAGEGRGALRADVGEADFGERRGDARRVGLRGRPRATLRAALRCSNRVSDWNRIETGRCSGGSAVTSRRRCGSRPSCGREEAGDEVEQRRFARAACAADGGDLAGCAPPWRSGRSAPRRDRRRSTSSSASTASLSNSRGSATKAAMVSTSISAAMAAASCVR